MSARDATLIESFIEMLVAERGASANTVAAYENDLTAFSDHLGRRAMTEASAEDIRRYLARLARDGLAPKTAARRLSALRQFYRFLHAEGVRGDDPTSAVDMPRLGRALPKLLSEEEVDALLAAARARTGAEAIRLLAMVEILYATGLRVSELVGLPLSAVARDPRLRTARRPAGKSSPAAPDPRPNPSHRDQPGSPAPRTSTGPDRRRPHHPGPPTTSSGAATGRRCPP